MESNIHFNRKHYLMISSIHLNSKHYPLIKPVTSFTSLLPMAISSPYGGHCSRVSLLLVGVTQYNFDHWYNVYEASWQMLKTIFLVLFGMKSVIQLVKCLLFVDIKFMRPSMMHFGLLSSVFVWLTRSV